MTKSKSVDASIKLSEVIVKGMQEKKALDIVVMDLREVKNAVADFFIICSGNSDKHLASISQSVDDEVFKTLQEDPWRKEGKHNKEWMLLDYVSVVVHVFKKDKREFYSLETLWGDAVLKKIKNIDEAMDQPKEEVRRVIDVNSDRLRTLIMEANRFEKPVEKLVEEPIIELKVAAKTKPTKLVKAKAVKESKVAKTKQSTETKVKKVAGKKASLKKVVKAKKSKPITKPALAKEKPQKVKATKVTVKKTKVVIKSSKSIKKK